MFACDRFTLFKVIDLNDSACISKNCTLTLLSDKPTLAFFGTRSPE